MQSNKRGGWYLAELVLRFDIQDAPSALVHINSILVSASSDEIAFEKALKFGSLHSSEYVNTDRKLVRISFVGLRNLYYIYEDLEDGSELVYEEISGLSETDLANLVRPKRQLAVFSSRSDEE